MERQTVKKLLTLSDEVLEDAELCGLVRHREVAKHYAEGGDVETQWGIHGWEKYIKPNFLTAVNYRKALPEIQVFGVKVRANPPETKPLEADEKYYYLDMERECMYSHAYWYDDLSDNTLLKNKVIWKKEEDIQAVVKALKGGE